MVHASRGRLEPGEPASAVRAGHRRAGWPARVLGDGVTHALGGLREGLRARSATASPASSPASRTSTRACARPGGFTLPHAPRDERRFPTATGKANFTAAPVEYPRAARGPAAAADPALARPVQHHDLRPRRPLPRHQERPPRRAGQPRRTRAALGLADGAYVDLVSEWTDGVERRAPGFRVVHYPTARGCAAAYYPETNVLVPLDATADTSNTPASKSVVVRPEQID